MSSPLVEGGVEFEMDTKTHFEEMFKVRAGCTLQPKP